jgi:S-adenosylmethionine uptake transporter
MIKAIPQNLHGVLIGLTAFTVLSFADTCTKALTAHYDVFAVGLYLNYFTTAALIPVVIYKGGFRKAFQTESLKFHALRSCFMLIIFLSIIYALKHLPIANTYTITYTMPFILNLLAMVLLKEKISLYRWLAIIGAFIGILVALRPGTIPLNSGSLAAFSVAVFLACAAITVKFISQNDKWLTFVVYPMAIQTPIMAMIVWARGEPLIPTWDSSSWAIMVVGGTLFAAGLTLLPQAIKRMDTSIFGYTQYITFIWAMILGYFIFGDVLDLWTAAGAAIIVASGIFLIYREKLERSKILDLEEHGSINQR